MLPWEIAVYALVAFVSTAFATPTPAYTFKQITREDVVRRARRGVRPRAPVPSGAGGAPNQAITSNDAPFDRYFTGSGAILSANPSGADENHPSAFATYANTVSTANAVQQCIELAVSQPGGNNGMALWFDESDDLWHCRTTYNGNSASDFTAVDANARPVYGYNIVT